MVLAAVFGLDNGCHARRGMAGSGPKQPVHRYMIRGFEMDDKGVETAVTP